MYEKIVELAVCAAAVMVVMMLHEFPKSVAYAMMSEKKLKDNIKIFKIWSYIDPVGFAFGLISYAPFSRPYMFRVSKKRTNMILGISGFAVLIFLYAFGIMVLRRGFGGLVGLQELSGRGASFTLVVGLFFYMVCQLTFGMFIVNLFPVSTFDMGLMIAGKSPAKYFGIIKSDGEIKMILIFVLILDIIHVASIHVTQFLLL